jgi:uncharacterized membrane protein
MYVLWENSSYTIINGKERSFYVVYKSFSMSSIIALVSILSMAYKEFFLNKESNLFIDYTIIISTVLYFYFYCYFYYIVFCSKER